MVDQAILDVIEGRRDCFGMEQGQPLKGSPAPIIFPCSFNPVHDGHRGMAEYIARVQDAMVDFELSVTNVDKATISLDEIKRRLRQFEAARIWITRAPTFAEKAELFPNRNFIIGADTAVRLFQPKYYASPQDVERVFRRIDELACRFLVFGRKVSTEFESADSLSIPGQFKHLFAPISEVEFRMDISSRDLRSKGTE